MATQVYPRLDRRGREFINNNASNQFHDERRALYPGVTRGGRSPRRIADEGTVRRTRIETSVGNHHAGNGGWNAAKRAAGLPTHERGESGRTAIKPKPDWVEVPDVIWEELDPQQRWYYKNRERRIAVKSRRKDRSRRWFHDLKQAECACERCGEDHPACIDFHHIDEKERGVAEMVNFEHSKESIRTEIDRCVVLCANCHRKEHYEPPGTARSSQN